MITVITLLSVLKLPHVSLKLLLLQIIKLFGI
jgi:hypothetical protein